MAAVFYILSRTPPAYYAAGGVPGQTIFRTAYQKLNGEETSRDIDIEQEIKKLNKLLKNVEPFNLDEAKMQISEACLDAEYINNPSTNIYSFRLYRAKQELERLKKNNEEER